ncbi:helicase-associated domain-containing protein [Gemmata sp. JC673]|uniref:DNA 3'-5' helicase n=2 Tax=Gemmata algarum TaxID=2975278 RepID=A0ABU5F056_9BACT|nr:DNA repair helicase XPB [Gemmata algarum]MDY3560859.1 helicase-associated domain-containing protein [Gemmata algarum]
MTRAPRSPRDLDLSVRGARRYYGMFAPGGVPADYNPTVTMPPKITKAAPAPAAPMTFDPTNPFIVQSDRSVLVEVDNPKYTEARDAIAPFAELEKSPEHIHTYRISNLSLWNAAAAGFSADEVVGVLQKYTKFPIPQNIPTDIAETVSRYGRVKLERIDAEHLKLVCPDKPLLAELARNKKVKEFLGDKIDDTTYGVSPAFRGVLKQALITVGYPAEDIAGYTEGAMLPMELRETAASGVPFRVRDYQREAADVFHAGGDVRGGSGVIVLPCGAGKTVVGIASMCLLQKNTLVLTTSITAVKQWRREIIDKTTLTEDEVKEYTGETKDIGPVTVATYQIITYRPDKTEAFPHFGLFEQRDWGLIVYDEVHLLPAPVFRVTAQIQARRRLGLTATLIREDGREGDVFSLIGPKKYDVPWRELETKGWIASASCSEIRVALPTDSTRMEYAVADHRAKYRIASENVAKDEVVAELLKRYHDQRVIVIGQYLSQLKRLSERFEIPMITGSTGNAEREDLYGKFRRGEVRHLVLSKVGNFAIDLPDANVLIQVSGTFGSRQEEAQRLGRILRPKSSGDGDAHFFTLVTRDTRELDFAHHRQMFLTEQGYSYEILDERDVIPPKSAAE